MSKRHDDRYGRGGRWDRDRADDRGYVERAGDEMRSWFGDDDAQRRRHMDEQLERERERYRSDWNRSERDQRSRADWSRGSDLNQRGQWEQRPNWGRQQDWRDRSANVPMRYREREGSWSSSDWDRNRDFGRDDRTQWADTGRDFVRDDTGSSYDAPRHNAGWSLDDGRTEFRHERWGRGPKGYQRTDARIHEEVCDRLTYSDVDAENIEVRVENGEVTLAGSVRDRWDKRRAEDLAEEIPGVRDVHNNIRVHRADRGIGQSDTSASDQPGTVLGVNPTASSTIANTPPKGSQRS
jgi:osmotically-inducible protein OsmY